MEWLVAIVKFLILLWSSWRESNQKKKELKKQALEELKDAIKTRDPSKLTAANARANRVRR